MHFMSSQTKNVSYGSVNFLKTTMLTSGSVNYLFSH